MKNTRTIFGLLVLSMLLGSTYLIGSVDAQTGQRAPRGIELPEGWEDLTDEEKQAYRQANRPERGEGRGQRGNFELPEGWEDLTDEEKQAYRQANRPEGGEGREGRGQRGNFEAPEGWEDLTDEEKQAYRQANRPEGEEGREGRGQRGNKKSARKASNYKKFSGTLKQAKRFSDDGSIENQTAVSYLQQRGIIDGYEDGSFGPRNPINRAESLKVLLEALGETVDETSVSYFSDVPANAWFAKYVNLAKEKGIVAGYEDGSFQPGTTVNQVELLKLAFESFGIDLTDYPVTSSDIDQGAWYGAYLQYALDNELLDTTAVNPGEGMTRDAFSEVLYRLIQQQESL